MSDQLTTNDPEARKLMQCFIDTLEPFKGMTS
jgi:hypothetical protein